MIYVFSANPRTVMDTLDALHLPCMLITKELFTEFSQSYENRDGDIGIVYDFGKIIPESLLTRLRMINIHFSLLPKYRGATPVEATILNGEDTTGITLQWVATKVDEGDVLLQREYEIEEAMTAGALQKALDGLIPELLQELFAAKDWHTWQSKPQIGEATYCYKSLLSRESAKLSMTTMSASEIVRKVRAFNPEPLAWLPVIFNGKEKEMNVLSAEEYVPDTEGLAYKPGALLWLKKRGVAVAMPDGYVLLNSIVVSGSKQLVGGDIVALKGKLEFVL